MIASFCGKRPDGGKSVTEIRLRADAPLSLTIDRKNVLLPNRRASVFCERELRETLGRLCEDSVHTYGDTIKEGYATIMGGDRIGVCGSAGSDGDKIKGIYRISSLCIRIPHAITGVCGELIGKHRSGCGDQNDGGGKPLRIDKALYRCKIFTVAVKLKVVGGDLLHVVAVPTDVGSADVGKAERELYLRADRRPQIPCGELVA